MAGNLKGLDVNPRILDAAVMKGRVVVGDVRSTFKMNFIKC